MSYYDPFQRYNRPQRPATQRVTNPYQGQQDAQRRQQPTVEDYHRLVQAHQELQQAHEEAMKKFEASQEALRQQTKTAIDLKEERDAARQELEQVRAQANALEQERQQEEGEWQQRHMRLQAEMENVRKRLDQRSAAEVLNQRNRILEDMLSLADHLEMALQHVDGAAPTPAEGNQEVNQNFRQSLEATLRAFLETLKKYGVQPIEPLGQPFDPQIHEAIGQIPNPEVPADHVASVVRTGYLVDEQLLRPARVLLSTGA